MRRNGQLKGATLHEQPTFCPPRVGRDRVVPDSLEGVAGVFWSLLQEDGRDEAVVAALRLRYAAPDAELKSAWQDFVRSLADEDLVRHEPVAHVVNGSPMNSPSSDGPQPFTLPKIEKFEDMKEMLLLDPIHDVSVGGWPHQA